MKGLSSIALLISVLIFSARLKAQEPLRAAVYYKSSTVTGDQNDFQSACHMMEVAGLPYDVISASEDISDYRLVLAAVRPDPSNTTEQDITRFSAYLSEGGTLVLPMIRDIRFYEMAGVAEMIQNAKSPVLNWQTNFGYEELMYFDDPYEIQTSLGKNADQTIPAGYYVLADAVALARYADGEAGVVRNAVGQGYCYSFGFRWREVVLRNQLGYDYSANRSFSNGFEPSADVFPLFIRALWIKVCPSAVWKHTSPEGTLSSLMITHDVDSRTGMDTMQYFSTYEKGLGIRTHYFVTTRYFEDDLGSKYYNPTSIEQILAVMADGHSIGSHSVGHFPDMKDSTVFPVGTPDVNPYTYQPRYYELNGFTTGGTLWGEARVSKALLETDLQVSIRSWRPGHLLTPKYMFQVLDSAGYAYSSTFSANDILCNFPFMNMGKLSFYGTPTDLLEIPMTLSDVYSDNPITPSNYPQLVETWKDVIEKNRNNQAPTVLLIHPNRRYKVDAEALLIQSLPTEVGLVNFDQYADFWVHRLQTDFSLRKEGDSVLTLVLKQADLDREPPVSFAIRNQESFPAIRIENEMGEQKAVHMTTYPEITLIHPRSMTTLPDKQSPGTSFLGIYPNPATEYVIAKVSSLYPAKTLLTVYNSYTGKVFSQEWVLVAGANLTRISIQDWAPGFYWISLEINGRRETARLLIAN